MALKHKYFYFLVWLSSIAGYAQNIIPSTAYVQSCYDKHECFSISNSALIFFNTNSSELLLQVDFNKFKVGNDTLDDWLKDLSENQLVFKAQLNTNDLLLLSHHNSKSIIVNGVIDFNGVSKPHKVELNFFEVTKNGLLSKENAQDYFDRVNVNMQLAFHPKEFNIDKKRHHYKKSITIAIYRGYINELKPDMKHLTN